MDLILTDGPPGIGCPVIASIGGATALLIVTEPTVSGVHDMERAISLAEHFNMPAMVCVNKYDLNLDQTQAIEQFVKKRKMTFLGKIPFDPIFTESMVHGKTIFEYSKKTGVNQIVEEMWNKIINSPEMNPDV